MILRTFPDAEKVKKKNKKKHNTPSIDFFGQTYFESDLWEYMQDSNFCSRTNWPP